MGTRKNLRERSRIDRVAPESAIAGGEIHILGAGLAPGGMPLVRFGGTPSHVVVGSDSRVVVRVPAGAEAAELSVGNGGGEIRWPCRVGRQVADGLHPVANPAVDSAGNVFTTFSGSRGQKTPVAVFRINRRGEAAPFITDLMNATGLAFDRDGGLLISSRHDGTVYRAAPDGRLSVHVEGMGVATGLAFDAAGNLYVGDRSGTIFKISQDRQVFVFATLEPSMAAYHLAFGPDGYLYVSGPTTSSFDTIHRISPAGDSEVFYRGLGRPQGIAFDLEGRLYVAASVSGRKGIVRIGTNRSAELFLSGPNVVGLAFAPGGVLYVATTNALHRVEADIEGMPL